MEFVAKPVPVEKLADGQFGFGVLASHFTHIVATLCGSVYIGHEKR